jgi:hypothetical protein
VKDLPLPVGWYRGIGLVPVADNAGDRATKVLLVEAECLLTVSAVIQVDVEFHEIILVVL